MLKGEQNMQSQRDLLRELVRCFGMDEEKLVQEYAAAERRGEVRRNSNKSGLTPEGYARALWRDGVRKAWLR